MFLEAAVSTAAAAAVLWYLLYPDPEPLYGIYSQPGRLFHLKKWFIYCAIRFRRLRATEDPRLQSVREGRYIYKPGHPVDALESVQELPDSKHALDAVYFNGMNTDGACVAMRIARRHDREAELWLSIKLPGVGCFQSPTHPHTIEYNTDGKSFSAGGLRFECVEPHLRWRVAFNGLLRKGLHDTWPGSDDSNVVHARFSFYWMAFSDPFIFQTECDPWLKADAIARESWTATFWQNLRQHYTHYEGWGELRGAVNIEGHDEIKLHLKGCKSRSFGIHDKGSVHRSAAHYGFVEDGTTFNLMAVSLPNATTNFLSGYLNWPNSLQYPINRTSMDMANLAEDRKLPHTYQFNFTANGVVYAVDVEADKTAAYYCGHDWNNVVFQMMCPFTVNGKKGCGIVDLMYKRPGGDCPVPPETSVPMFRQPSAVPIEDERAFVLSFDNPSCCSSTLVGGKGCQLAMLTQMKTNESDLQFRVPVGFCLTITAFETHIQESNDGYLQKKLAILSRVACGKQQGDLQSACEDTVRAFQDTPLSEAVEDAIKKHLPGLRAGGEEENVSFAVRSSAAGEDGEELSGAGMMDTILGVKGLEQIFTAVTKCWSSNYAFPAVEYRRQNGQLIDSPIAVVIQRMVAAEAAGVLFTRNPLDGNPSFLTVNANYGLGESVVSGHAEPDTLTVKRSLQDEVKLVKTEIGGKKLQIKAMDGGGTEELDLSPDVSDKCCVSEDIVLRLARIGIWLEKSFASPRDVEWAVAGGNIHLLQARPITTMNQESDWELIHEFDSPLTTDKTMLSRHNVAEVSPHATKPLEMHFLSNQEDVFQVSNVSMGLFPFIKRHSLLLPSFSNKLFLNLHYISGTNVETVYGADHNVALLSICGMTIPELTLSSIRDYNSARSPWRRLVNCANQWKMIASKKGIEEWAHRLETYSIDMDGRTARELYDDINDRLGDQREVLNAHSDTAFASIGWKTVILKLLAQGVNDPGSEQYADLAVLLSKTSHEKACSADVPGAVQELASVIRKGDPERKFVNMSPEQGAEWLRADKGEIGQKFTAFMKQHGHRSIYEMSLFQKSWRQDPTQLIQSLQAIARSAEMPNNTANAVDDVDVAIAAVKSPITSTGRWLLRRIVPRARKATGNREFSKAVVVKMSDHFKRGYWTLARLMVEEGRLPDEKLLFYLTKSELGQLLNTRSASLVARAKRRKRIHTQQDQFEYPLLAAGYPQPSEPDDTEDISFSTSLTLQGTPVSQGFFKGVARVVRSIGQAHTIEAGDILVVQATDVGWSPFFPLIGGLVTEIGGLLSHGVVVAREYGIPCVANIPRATVLLKTGDVLVLDASKGKVERLQPVTNEDETYA